MILSQIPIGQVVLLEWNREAVQLVHKSDCRATIRSLSVNGEDPERDVSPATSVLLYEGEKLGNGCACGCGKIVIGERNTRKYATNAFRNRLYKRNGRGDAKSVHLKSLESSRNRSKRAKRGIAERSETSHGLFKLQGRGRGPIGGLAHMNVNAPFL
jgi:hypothetical protein